MAKFPTLYGSDKDDVLFGSGEDEMGYVPSPFVDRGTKPRKIRPKSILCGKRRDAANALFGQEFLDRLENKVESKALMKVGLSSKGRRLSLKVKEDGIYTLSGMKICGRFLIY